MSITVWKRGVTFVSATLADHGAGAATGNRRTEPDGRLYVLLKAAGAITQGELVIKDAVTGTEVTVVISAGVTNAVMAVNNTGATALATGDYFWGLQQGIGYCDPDATGWNDGDKVAPAASGEVQVAAIGNTIIGVAINDDTATIPDNLIMYNLPAGASIHA